MKLRSLVLLPRLLVALAVWPLCCALPLSAEDTGARRELLAQRLPLYGHRNWICIVDSVYPAQTSPGVETVVTGADPLTVVREVLAALGKTAHVKPVAMIDAELPLISEAAAPGVGA